MKALRSLWHTLGVIFAKRPKKTKSSRINPGSTRLILVELQRRYDSQHSTWDKLDEKLISLLGWATVTFAVLASLNLGAIAASGSRSPIIALIASLALFLGVLVVCIWGLLPRNYEDPISTNWAVMYESYLARTEEDAAEQLLAQYGKVIDLNTKTILYKARKLLAGFILFAALAVTLLVATIYPFLESLLH